MKITRQLPLILILSLLLFGLFSCSGKRNSLATKGFSVETTDETRNTEDNEEVNPALEFRTRPSSVLSTNNPTYRLTTIYKVNYDKEKKRTFIGSNYFHFSYNEDKANNWHSHFIAGLSAVYGYNFVNVSHYNTETKTQKTLFEEPVLIRTMYYPAFNSDLEKDTLNYKAIERNYILVSAYDEDTNKDNKIDAKDLRRFYYFDMEGNNKMPLVPTNYSVLSSEYDMANDFMYVFAKQDTNKNGSREEEEEIHIFWIDLNNPQNKGRNY
jgi:hypothetical protein